MFRIGKRRPASGETRVEAAAAPPPAAAAEPAAAVDTDLIPNLEADVRRARARLSAAATDMDRAAADGVRHIAAIRGDSDHLAGETEEAKGNIRRLAGALDEVAGANAEIGRTAQSSDRLVSQAEAVSAEATSANDELRGAISEIAAAVSLIADIARQTNLLALNASIEAARAGKAGAGFAVVASEVKALAVETQQATAAIAGRIERLRAASDTSTGAIDRVIAIIGEIRPVASAVADAVAVQVDTIAEIGRTAAEAASFADDVAARARSIRDAAGTAAATGATIAGASTAMAGGVEDMTRRLLTVLRQSPMGDRRRHDRWPVEIAGRLTIDGKTVPVRTIDLSLGGSLVAGADKAMVEGRRGRLELDGLGAIACRVAATSALGCHLAFDEAALPVVVARVEAIAEANRVVLKRAAAAAAAVSAALEAAVAQGRLSLDALFDTDYRPLDGTDPQQFETKALKTLETILPPLQEPILAEDGKLAFACAVDINGYLPVHNARYAQPQRPGERAWNTANCRNRRVFDDRAGLLAARNTRPHLVQAYARDLGDRVVMMKEVDVPIHVAGRHWGGFRTAYVM